MEHYMDLDENKISHIEAAGIHEYNFFLPQQNGDFDSICIVL